VRFARGAGGRGSCTLERLRAVRRAETHRGSLRGLPLCVSDHWPHLRKSSTASVATSNSKPWYSLPLKTIFAAICLLLPAYSPGDAGGVQQGDTRLVQLFGQTLHVTALGTEALRVVIEVR